MPSQLLRSAALAWIFSDDEHLVQINQEHRYLTRQEFEEAILVNLQITEAAYAYLGDTVSCEESAE